MKKIFILFAMIMTIPGVLLLSCKKETSINNEAGNGGNNGGNPAGNKSPIAIAGPDQTIILPTDSVILNGSRSFDPDGSISSYLWSKISGPSSVLIKKPNTSVTTVINLKKGRYEFELKVTDDKGMTSRDVVTVVVNGSYLGPGHCDISNVPLFNTTLFQIGDLSSPQAPYVAACGSKIFFAGGAHGYSGIDIYDVNQHSWSKAELSKARTNMAIVSCGNKVFFAGGNNRNDWYDIVDIYDVSTGNWTVEHLSEPKSFLAAGAVGDKVFFAGGITEEGWNQTNVIDIYDISEGTWSTANLSEAKIGVCAVTAGNKIYFAGGFNYLNSGISTSPYLKGVDIYDASSDSWSYTSLRKISGNISGVAHGDKIYWGGIDWSDTTGMIEIWNNQNGGVETSCLAYPRIYPTAVVKNNEVIFFPTGAGAVLEFELSDRIDIYNTVTGARSIGRLSQPFARAAIISINNTIYMAGGVTPGGHGYEVYVVNW